MGETFAGFQRADIGGLPVLWRRDERFKTLRVTFTSRRPLDDRAAARSLLPSLLLHGTVDRPDRPAMARRMEELYGAGVMPGTDKVGEQHLLRGTIDAVAGRFLPGAPDQVGDTLAFLAEILTRPRLDAGAFPARTFERERRHALDAVRGLIDDRATWSAIRALEVACEGEPMAIPEHGGQAALEAVDAGAPEAARADFLRHGQAVLVAGGAFDDAAIVKGVERFVAALPERDPQPIPDVVTVGPRETRRVTERVELRQSRSVLVFRCPPPPDEDVWPARRLFVAMLGGGPQSRLFREVREKRSLAYYASADLERHKGLMTVRTGLDEANAPAAAEETLRQLALLQRGEFTDDELEAARARYLASLDAVEDSVASMCRFAHDQWLLGIDRRPEDLADRYRSIGRDEVVAAGQGIWLDTEYLLAPRANGGEER